MKKSQLYSRAAAVFVVLWVAAGAALAGDDRTLDIRHHDLDVRLDTDAHRLEGFDRITFVAADRANYSFYLGIPLEVTRARLDGKRIKLERIEIDYGSDAPGTGPRARARPAG